MATFANFNFLLMLVSLLSALLIPSGCVALSAAPFTERRTGSTSWQIDGGDQFTVSSVHEFESIQGADDCDRLVLTVTVGAKFWDLSVSHRYSCHCSPTWSCEPPAEPSWPAAYLHPFYLSFVDVTTSNEYQIMTRRNSPDTTAAGRNPTTLTITSAVDVRKITSAIRVDIQFFPPATTDFTTGVVHDDGGYDCGFTDEQKQYTGFAYTGNKVQDFTLMRNSRLKTQIVRSSTPSAPTVIDQTWTINRKKPFPSFQLDVQSECCGTEEACPLHSVLMQGQEGMFSQPVTLPLVSTPCCHTYYSYLVFTTVCSCFNYSASVKFFETARMYEANYSFQQYTGTYNYSDPGNTVDLIPDEISDNVKIEGDFVTVDTVGSPYPLKLKFVKHDLAPDFYGPLEGGGEDRGYAAALEADIAATLVATGRLNLTENPTVTLQENHTVLAMYLIQPFPIQDLWITITDNNGTVMFEDQEMHVPYVPAENQGAVGWFYAIDHDPWRFNYGININVKYNRRKKTGRNDMETRALMLQNWVRDIGGHLSHLHTPLPQIYTMKKDIYGSLAKQDFSVGDDVGTVPQNAIITGTMAEEWYRRHLKPKAEWPGSNFTTLLQNVSFGGVRGDDAHGRDRLMMSLMVAFQGTNPLDNSSSFFVYFDSFFPKEPQDLPYFVAEDNLERLLGWSELPTFVWNQREFWWIEWTIIHNVFKPWFSADVSLTRWRSIRAWVEANAYWNGTDYVLVPGANLMRKPLENPNVRIEVNPNTGYVHFKPLQSITTGEELLIDFFAGNFSKHYFFLTYGQIPEACGHVTTIPGENGVLWLDSYWSRFIMVHRMMNKYGGTYAENLGRLLSLIGVKLGNLPVAVDGKANSPELVRLATKLLDSERTVLTQQFLDGSSELEQL